MLINISTLNFAFTLHMQDLIHGAPIGKPVSSSARVTAVYMDDDGTEMTFSRV